MTAVNVILSIIKRFWKEMLIGALLVALMLSVKTCKKNVEEKIIYRNNASEYSRDVSEKTKLLNLTDDELEKALTDKMELQWVLDSLKKNPKVITEIQYIKSVRTVRDTTVVVRTVNLADTSISSTYEDCGVLAKFTWPLGAAYGEWEITQKTELAIVGVNERRNLWGQKFLPRWGRREYSVHVLNQCNDSLITNYKLQRR